MEEKALLEILVTQAVHRLASALRIEDVETEEKKTGKSIEHSDWPKRTEEYYEAAAKIYRRRRAQIIPLLAD